MKVIIVGPAHPFRGGIADTNESLARAFIKNGHRSEIVTFSLQYPKILFPGKTQYSPDPKPKSPEIKQWINSINPFSWGGTAKKILNQNPDLVIIRFWLPFMGMALGSIAKKLKRKVKVIALCDNIIPHEKRIGDYTLTNYFLKNCDAFIAMSKTVVGELKQFNKEKILYLPHPINDNLGTKVSKKSAREKLGLDIDKKYLLFFGLVRKYKGLDILLDAMGETKLKDLGINLIVAGEFYDPPEFYLEKIKKLQLEENVIIEDAFIATEDIKYYFSAADIVTQTYRTASQSGVSQIAYNFEVPILVTNVGGLSETVPHGKVGYVTSKEPEDIANAIVDFYISNKSEEFIQNIKEEKKKYSWTKFAEKVLEFVD